MNEAPVDVLKKKVDYYKRFLTKLKTKEGITLSDDMSYKEFVEKINSLISKTNTQINVYRNAIKILKKANLKT